MSKDVAPELPEKPVCGLVMPISSIDGCDELHWKDVLAILSSSIRDAGFDANLVSNDTDVGVIHKRIVQNLYNNPIVVCDVSGKNPNVMFELGMRLAFDKPVIIVKDEKTPYSFDTSPVEHLTYPRDLRFGSIVEFQSRLTEKIRSSVAGKNSFLSSFGTFKVAELKEESAGALEIIMEEIASIKHDFRRSEERRYRDERRFNEYKSIDAKRLAHSSSASVLGSSATFTVSGSAEARAAYYESLKQFAGLSVSGLRQIDSNTDQYLARLEPGFNTKETLAQLDQIEKGVEVTIEIRGR